MTDSNVTFDSLKINKSAEDKIIKINNKEVIVKQYLPINEKLNLISRILSAISGNEYNFVNPVQLDVYTTIEVIKAYTNIDFAEDADPAILYDELEQEEIANAVISAIPPVEYDFVVDGVQDTVAAYYAYQNSVLGILENVSQDYSNLNFEASDIQKKLADPDNLALLKDVVKKLG